MCGIAGILERSPQDDLPARIGAAAATLQHRGPDDLGFLGWNGEDAPRIGREPEVCAGARLSLVHRRLSILDLSDASWQPMGSPDGRYHLSFNGEIYNFRELRAQLETAGRRFTSSGDTEVLLAAWERWGPDAVSRLTGMFAFALLDTRERVLWLVRDLFGIKPLYYCHRPGRFAFASEIGALLPLADMRAQMHAGRVYDYLHFGLADHDGHTMFEGVRRLPPAHLLAIPLDAPATADPERYHHFDLDRRTELPFDRAAEQLRETFLESVRLHLRSDVPVGAALSGGIDSSAIVHCIRHLQPDQELHAISYIADDPRISEEPHIRTAARSARAELHLCHPAAEDLPRDLDALIAAQDEPFVSTSIYAQRRVFELARERGIKVMLDGQGADELLAGYRPYVSARLGAMLRGGDLGGAAGLLSAYRRLPGATGRELAYGLADVLVPRPAERAVRALTGKQHRPDWLDCAWFGDRGVALDWPIPRVRERDALRHVLHADLTRWKLPLLLRYEDRNSMACSIESRVPFLTRSMAELALSLPEPFLIGRDGTSKRVFRAAMRGLVPDSILDRRDKIGFATPEHRWLEQLSDWVEQTLASETAHALPFLRIAHMRERWRRRHAGSQDVGFPVWRVLNLIRWAALHGMRADP